MLFLFGFLFFSQHEKSFFTSEGLCSIISWALISLPHSPVFQMHEISLHLATGFYFLSYFPGRASLFWKTKDPASTATLLTTYFRMTSDPGGLHFSSAVAGTVITQESPVSKNPPMPLWIAKGVIEQTRMVTMGIRYLQGTSPLATTGTSSL